MQNIQTLGIVPVFEPRCLSTLEVTNRRGEAGKGISPAEKSKCSNAGSPAGCAGAEAGPGAATTGPTERPLFAALFFVYFCGDSL